MLVPILVIRLVFCAVSVCLSVYPSFVVCLHVCLSKPMFYGGLTDLTLASGYVHWVKWELNFIVRMVSWHRDRDVFVKLGWRIYGVVKES